MQWSQAAPQKHACGNRREHDPPVPVAQQRAGSSSPQPPPEADASTLPPALPTWAHCQDGAKSEGTPKTQQLRETLQALADRDHCVFAASDLAAAVPGCGQLAVLLSRAAKAGILRRVCKGVYLYPVRDYPSGHLVFHAAARLRAGEFNYISLETALSDAGVIPQVPINWVTLMTSGRSHVVDCGDFGHIEFVHTAQRPEEISAELTYDLDRHLWRASVGQALRDMRATRRSMELVDEEVLHELI